MVGKEETFVKIWRMCETFTLVKGMREWKSAAMLHNWMPPLVSLSPV